MQTNPSPKTTGCIGAQLFSAAHDGQWAESIRILKEDPTRIHLTDPLGDTVLHLVAASGNVDIARQLEKLVGSRSLSQVLTQHNSRGTTPLSLALNLRHEEMVECLYDAVIAGHYRDDDDDNDDRTVSGSYAFYSDIEIEILNRAFMPDEDNDRAKAIQDLYLGVLRKRRDVVQRVLEEHPGLVPHKEPGLGTALHQAASAGDMPMLRLLLQHAEEQASLIVEGNDDQDTALHLALKKGHKDVARYLIQLGPGAACQANRKGVSPLYLAVEKGYEDLVTYMYQVVQNSAFVISPVRQNLLQSDKASLAHAAIRARNLGILRVTMEKLPGLIDVADHKGWRPLSYAAYKGYLDEVRYLVNNFPSSVNMFDINGSLPIHKAVGGGALSKSLRCIALKVKEFALHCPQTLHCVDQNGQTVLHFAVKCTKADVLSYLTK